MQKKIDETFHKLLNSKDGSAVIQIQEEIKTGKFMMEMKNFKRVYELIIIIRCTLRENSGIHHLIPDFVGIHRKGLQRIHKIQIHILQKRHILQKIFPHPSGK